MKKTTKNYALSSLFALSVWTLAIFGGATVAAAQGSKVSSADEKIQNKKFQKVENPVPNSYIVVFKEDDARIESLKSPEQITQFAEDLAAGRNAEVALVYGSALKGFSARMTEEAARALSKDARVAYVVEDGYAAIAATQYNPPSWGLDRIDQQYRPYTGSYNWTATGGGVRAYVIDTGIQPSHPEFGGRAGIGADFTPGGNGVDCNGHGTHVAATLAGSSVGVARAVSVIGVRVGDCPGNAHASWIVAGIDWVRANAVRPAVANMSLRVPANQAIDDATRSLINSGVVTVVAAGNENNNAAHYSPARVGEAIVVGATDYNDNRAGFSNYGAVVDIFAPGVGIHTAGLNNSYATLDGTSLAAPHVAGAAAMYLNVNPWAHPHTVRDVLVHYSTKNVVGDAGAGSPNHLLFSGIYNSCGVLYPGQALYRGWSVTACNGATTLVMQPDGNAVLYKNYGSNAGRALWHTNTWQRPDAAYLPMQQDGNFVLYGNGGAVWNSGTWNNPGAFLRVQDDSNLVVYRANGQAIWASGTSGR